MAEVSLDFILYLTEAGIIGAIIGLVAGKARGSGKSIERDEAVAKNSVESVNLQHRIASQNYGVERVLARRFYEELKKALAEGRVRVELVSDECRGSVAYDFALGGFVCVERRGVRRLGEEPAEDVVDEFEEVGDGDA